ESLPEPEEKKLPKPEEKATPSSEPPGPAPSRVENAPARATVPAFASLGKIKGDVFVFAGSPARKSPASEGQVLSPGQGVLTEGAQSAALVSRHDSVQLTLGSGAEIRFAEIRPEIALFQGKLEVEAGPREPGQEVLITTAHAEVRVAECRFTLTSTPVST